MERTTTPTPTRWSAELHVSIPSDPKIEAFLDEVEAVCRRHGLSLGSEDTHRAFLIEKFSEENLAWLRQAHDARSPEDTATPGPGAEK